jgi:uncharacterized protein
LAEDDAPSGEGEPAETPGDVPVSRFRRRLKVYGSLLVFCLLCAGYGFWVEPYWVELTEHSVGEGAESISVLHLTDLHVADYGRNERWLSEQVRRLQPDLIVITGDVIRSPLDAARAAAAVKLLKQLQAPLGVFGCMGNHDDWDGQAALDVYAQGGVTLLDPEHSVSLAGGKLVVHGVARPTGRPRKGTAEAFDLLLSHYPIVLPRAAHAGMDLVVAGHTHGGQVRVPFWGSLWLPYGSGDYEQGWFRDGDTRMYVSRGLGMSILPVRFLSRPEVTLFRLRLAKG